MANELKRLGETIWGFLSANALSTSSGDTEFTRDDARVLTRQVFTWNFAADAAAATTTNQTLMTMPYGGRVISAKVVGDAALTANDTNNATLDVNVGAAGALTTAATVTTSTGGSGSWVADTPEDLPLSSTDSDRTFDPGEVLNYDRAKAGTGVVIPDHALTVEIEWESTSA